MLFKISCMFLLFGLCLSIEQSCPACSRYDYDEKLLERFIRMEYAFEKLLSENKALKKRVKADLDELKEEKTQLAEQVKADLESLTDDKALLKDAIKSMEAQQVTVERKMDELLNEVKTNASNSLQKVLLVANNCNEHIENTLQAIDEESRSPLVYFLAHNPYVTSPEIGDVIVYRTVETNNGSGYNSARGEFTAPTRGLYVFYVHTCGEQGALQIVKDGSVLLASAYGDSSYKSCSSAQVIVYLDEGQPVWVKAAGGGFYASSPNHLYEDSYRWTSFGGALINVHFKQFQEY